LCFGVFYLNNFVLDYSLVSRRLGEEGRVLMKVLVSADGSAENVQIEKSSGSERLDNAAINAVKRWRFIPAKKNNEALSAYVIVPVKFSLDS
jgi:periplasmic protein TonB